MFDHSSVREGMLVLGPDGEKLGRVVSVSPHSLRIGRSRVFGGGEVTARLTDIRELRGDELILAVDRKALRSGPHDTRDDEREENTPDETDLGTIAISRESISVNPAPAKATTRYVERTIGVTEEGGELELRQTRMDLPAEGKWSEELTQFVSVDTTHDADDGRAPDTASEPEHGEPLEHP